MADTRIHQINIKLNDVELELVDKKYYRYQRECVRNKNTNILPLAVWIRKELLK